MAERLRVDAGFLTLAELAASELEVGEDSNTPQPGDIADLRHDLTAELNEITADWVDRPDEPLRITKRRLRTMAICEAQILIEAETQPADPADPSGTGLNMNLAAGVVCDIAAAILAVNPNFPAEGGWLASMITAIGYERPEVVDFIESLKPDDREEFAALIDERCSGLPYLLGDLGPYRPTSHERIVVRMADAGVLMAAEIDLAVGHPRVLAEVKTGSYNNWIPEELRHYGLLVALRDGRAPKVGAAITLTDQRVSAVTLGLAELQLAARRVVTTARALVEVDQAVGRGEPVTTRPADHCRWCERAEVCDDADDLALASRP